MRKVQCKKLLASFSLLSSLVLGIDGGSFAAEWKGVDETVVERIAKEHGREAKPPLIDPGSGDLLLFAFLLAGACGGFAAGYYWRDLVNKKGP